MESVGGSGDRKVIQTGRGRKDGIQEIGHLQMRETERRDGEKRDDMISGKAGAWM